MHLEVTRKKNCKSVFNFHLRDKFLFVTFYFVFSVEDSLNNVIPNPVPPIWLSVCLEYRRNVINFSLKFWASSSRKHHYIYSCYIKCVIAILAHELCVINASKIDPQILQCNHISLFIFELILQHKYNGRLHLCPRYKDSSHFQILPVTLHL